MEAKTFREAYNVLQQHAETLREQDEPNIDELLDIVNQSVAAYKVCKTRIDAVETALEEALVGAGLDTGTRAAKAASSLSPEALEAAKPARRAASKSVDDLDEDMPF